VSVSINAMALLVPGAFKCPQPHEPVADLGFEAVYLSGAGLTNMYYGLPDLAFISLRDVVEHTAAIRDAVEIPLIVDIDTGFGNSPQRAGKRFARSSALAPMRFKLV
jgi:2-methylisocitrate lyase-like PEP mutase family enzyme